MFDCALVAAAGDLPCVLADEGRNRGMRILCVGVVPDVEKDLAERVDSFVRVGLGELSRLVDVLKEAGVRSAILAGKVRRDHLVGGCLMDQRFLKMLAGAKSQRANDLNTAVVKELSLEGIEVLEQRHLGRGLLAETGALGSSEPSDAEMSDIRYGLEILRVLGDLDIGQTVVVKDGCVMAVEAAEHTNEAIARGGTLAGGNGVVVKRSKKEQDLRFDVPTIGPNTIQSMHASGCSAIAIEAGVTFILHRERALELANGYGVSVTGVSPSALRPITSEG